MFARITKRKNGDGSVVEYLQIAHSVREPGSKHPRNKVLFGLGRVDRDADTLRALANGILRHLDRPDISAARDDTDDLHLHPNEEGGVVAHDFASRKVGIQLLLWALWKKLGIPEFFIERDSENGARQSRLAFLIVLNRALDPRSKHALPGWAGREIWCDNADELTAGQFYDVLDVIAHHDEALQRHIFEAMRALTNDTTDIALYDTSSTAFEMTEDDVAIAAREAEWTAWEQGDPDAPPPDVRRPQVVNDPPARLRGYSRDHRPDLPQIVIGLATTERGLPIRSWTFPGNTTDGSTVTGIQQDLAATGVKDTVFVGDRGMTSEHNLAFLESENIPFIVGKKLRDRSADIRQLLDTAGPMVPIDDERQALEVKAPNHEHRRLLLVRHAGRASHDAKVRASLIAAAAARAAKVNASSTPHPRAACELETRRALARLLTNGEDGAFRVDDAAVAREARLDGVMVLATNTTLSAARVAAAYQGLLRTEDGWRTMKNTESLRPIHHRREDRIRAHITCCALGLGLIRTVEHLTGTTWDRVVKELADVHRVTFRNGEREHATATRMSVEQRKLYEQVGAELPGPAVRRTWAV
ncbi:MAG: IS1634 family transposase [Gemmatimonadaceae bacterium]